MLSVVYNVDHINDLLNEFKCEFLLIIVMREYTKLRMVVDEETTGPKS